MKRPIEFRAKVLFTPPGQAPEWVYGHYYEGTINSIIVQRIPHGPTQDDPGGGEYLDTIAVRRETVGQWTGLKDSADIDIFEGDIVIARVTTTLNEWQHDEAFAIEFRQGCFCAVNARRGLPLSDCINKILNLGVRIAGSIHDNPELLNP